MTTADAIKTISFYELGKRVPSCEVLKRLNENKLNLRSYKGKPVIT